MPVDLTFLRRDVVRRVGAAGLAVAVLAVLLVAGPGASPAAAADISICDRTHAVEKAIEAALNDAAFNCAAVDEDDLDDIETLNVRGYGRISVRASDFSGLDGVTELDIEFSPALRVIPRGAFRQMAGLKTLDLSGNGIRYFETAAFGGLSSLDSLDLSYNEIQALPAGLFVTDSGAIDTNLAALTVLDLRANGISSLSSGAFAGLSGLEKLRLHSNEIREISVSAFRGLSSLTDLALNNNGLESLPAGVFSPLSSLDKLLLVNNNLSEVPMGAWAGTSPLTTLNLSSNRIASLPAGNSRFSFKMSGLEQLELSDNEITDVSATDFSGLSLEKLLLDANPVERFSADLLTDQTDLEELSLDGIEASSLPAGFFAGLESLRFLHLSNMGLGSLRAGVFDDLTDLRNLFLSNNELSSLDANIFANNTGLTFLQLSGNELASLDANIFSGLTSLEFLDLGRNELATLPESVFTGLDAVADLDLRNNRLTSLPENIFDPMVRLSTLELSGNRLVSLHVNQFADLGPDLDEGIFGLTELYLDDNRLGENTLPTDVFDPVTSLYTLGLRSNGLTGLNRDIFDELEELAELDLSCNLFTDLSSNRFDGPEDSLQYLDLAGNPWNDREGRQSTFEGKLTADLIVTTEDDNDCVALLSSGTQGPEVIRYIRPGAGTARYDARNEEWTVYVGADVDRVTISGVAARRGMKIVSAPRPDEIGDDLAGVNSYDADPHRSGVQIELRDARYHVVPLVLEYVNGDVYEYSEFEIEIIRDYREEGRQRTPCAPGSVSLNTVYSDGDGTRDGSNIPGLLQFAGPKREWMFLGWAAPARPDCIARTEVWRADGRTGVQKLVKAWNGSPGGPDGAEAWRDTGTRIGEAYQYTIMRFGTDGSFSHASTRWIPVLPFYLDMEKSWRDLPDLSDPETTIFDINNATYKMVLEVGGVGGEVGKGATAALSAAEAATVVGLYTRHVWTFKYAVLRDTGELPSGTYSVNFGGSAGTDTTGTQSFDGNRFSAVCIRYTKYSDPVTLRDRVFYNGCAVGDFILAHSIRQSRAEAQTARVLGPVPTGLAANVDGLGTDEVSVRLGWDAVEPAVITATEVSGFEVSRKGPGESEFSVLGTTGSSANSYTDTDVETGSSYVYRVRSSNPEGLSEPSDELSVEVPAAPPPPPPWFPAWAPEGLRASASDVSATLGWRVPSQPDEVYVVDMFLERLDDDDAVAESWDVESDLDTSEASSWLHFVDGLSSGTSYRFRVRLATEDQGDAYSQVLEVMTQSEPPVAPEGLEAVWADPDEGDSGVDLTWEIPDQPSWLETVLVRVERDHSNRRDDSQDGYWRKAGEVTWDRDTNTYSFNDPDVTDERLHRYRIAMYAGGRSHYSNVAIAPGPDEHPAGPLAGFSLIDAADQTAISRLEDGDSVELAGPDTGRWAIRADLIAGMGAGSVSLELDGPADDGSDDVGPVTVDDAPYSLHGTYRSGGDTHLSGGPLPAGDYTLTATAWSRTRLRGVEIGTLEIDFTITADPDYTPPDEPDPGPLASLSLIDASDQTLVGQLSDGDTIELDGPGTGSWAIRADIAHGRSVGSVGFDLEGPATHSQTENIKPYAIYGDHSINGQRQFHGRALPAGDYTLTVVAYASRRRGGDVLGTIEIAFTVTAAN